MSTLLEQAIVDAEALREAAIKNAEASIVEKYSSEIKAAVENLLEQNDTLEEESEESVVMNDVPFAPSEEVKEDAPVTIRLDLEALERALDEENSTEAVETHEDLAEEVLDEEVDSSEEFELDEEILSALAEELKVDVSVPNQGLGGRTTPTSKDLEGQEVTLAALKDDAAAEEHAALQKAREEADMYLNENKVLSSERGNLEKTVLHLKERLEEVNLSNARLLYTNRVLNSTSLNERQKTRIVESISNADSVEEAKVIYETLQSAVGEKTKSSAPQSLREAVEKPSPTLPRKRNNNNQAQVPQYSRMKALAGIKGGNN